MFLLQAIHETTILHKPLDVVGSEGAILKGVLSWVIRDRLQSLVLREVVGHISMEGGLQKERDRPSGTADGQHAVNGGLEAVVCHAGKDVSNVHNEVVLLWHNVQPGAIFPLDLHACTHTYEFNYGANVVYRSNYHRPHLCVCV